MSNMIAKLVISTVLSNEGQDTLTMRAVGRNEGYDEDGWDENNTYANYTPSAELVISIANPNLVGTFKPGDTFLVNFKKVDK